MRRHFLPRGAPRALLLAIGMWLACAAPAAAVDADFGEPGGRMRAYWWQGRLVVGVYPRPNEGYIQIARRVMAEPERYPAIKAFNRGKPVRAGVPVNFPIATLEPALWGQALRALYPGDEITERGWSHRVVDPLESLIQLSEAYTGSKGRFKALARYNELANPDVLTIGTEVVVPLHWIPDELGFRPVELKEPLALDEGEGDGRLYARYTVQPDDTLYSLLLRFTDREWAAEINRMARVLVRLNDLPGEKRLYAGRSLRIPLEWISGDYQVARFAPPRRLEPPEPAPPKRGMAPYGPVHVIVDAGHGGRDPGAVYGERGGPHFVYEHEVVYDVAVRLIRLLEAGGFQVHPTVEDPHREYPMGRLRPRALGRERVRVTPAYRMDSARTAVNMRVFFINALYRRLTGKQGVAPENVVLVSLHADALAPTLRGAMVYYPDHRLRAREFYPRGRVYKLRQEAVPTRIFFRQDDNRSAEEQSRAFGETVIAALKGRRLGVGHKRPVRPYYYRDGERTLPAVLRYSLVPTSVLVEVANLNNHHDRKLLLRPAVRQRVAEGLRDALDTLRADQGAAVASRKGA